MFVHLFSLIGFKKAVVFLNWVYNYIRFDREGRLIIRPKNEALLRLPVMKCKR
jgi:NADH dehydrogenase